MGQSVRHLFICLFIYLFQLVTRLVGRSFSQSLTLSFGRSVSQSVGQSICRESVPFHALINSVATERTNEGIVRSPGPTHR